MSTIIPNILRAIGNTPLVELDRFVKPRGLHGRIIIKLEYLNPGFSKKDRVGLHMIEEFHLVGKVIRERNRETAKYGEISRKSSTDRGSRAYTGTDGRYLSGQTHR